MFRYLIDLQIQFKLRNVYTKSHKVFYFNLFQEPISENIIVYKPENVIQHLSPPIYPLIVMSHFFSVSKKEEIKIIKFNQVYSEWASLVRRITIHHNKLIKYSCLSN